MSVFDIDELEELSRYGYDPALIETTTGRIIAKLCGQVLDYQENQKWIAAFSFVAGVIAFGVFAWVWAR